MAGEIILPVGSSAEPDTCGSCKFFERKGDNEYYRMHGFCRIELPKKFFTQRDLRIFAVTNKIWKDQEYTGNEDQIKDTDRCDLYRYSGKVYIVQRRIPPEKVG